MPDPAPTRPAWWGGRGHIGFTLVVFVVLASLDNAAAALIPAMVIPVRETLSTSSAAIGVLTGTVILLSAMTAAVWAYLGDRGSRKRLLLAGTAIWAIGSGLSATAQSFGQLFGYQLVVAVGLGSVASIGFSVISDFIAPRRRGLAMSLWGLSQGIGGLSGGLLASQLGADDFRMPMAAIAALGAGFAILYLVTFEAPRGWSEPALSGLHADPSIDYGYTIEPDQVPALARRPTNRWLIAQGLTAQMAYGSLIWVPLLYQEKVIAEGYSIATATRVGGLLGAIFQVGALFSVLTGHLGDRLQARRLDGRALISAVGILGAIPFFLAFLFLPLRGLDVTEGAGTFALIPEVLAEVVTNPWVGGAFLLAVVALAFTSANSPNWFALISDVNLPEHRGTVYGMGNLANGVGRSIGNALTGGVAGVIERAIPPPLSWALGLAVFQVWFLPTGYCYWRAAGTSPGDIIAVRSVLADRGRPPGQTLSE
ncbi:MAG: MFS transporter [Acidimicrobiia bacterium]|nr:MFS transporter [Acidimicrobiia bacterium]